MAWFDHLWSLSLEEQFYVVWPWLVFFLPMSWLKRVAPCWNDAQMLPFSSGIMTQF
jgi:peptidoglycan/LPS O-acetylase OafA/YrhL